MKKIFFLSFLAWGSLLAGELVMYKPSTCDCCDRWAKYMQQNGFEVRTEIYEDQAELKELYNVPLELSSCHTALIDGYVIEGHVPADEVKRLLSQKPNVVGIAVPDMPLESPGMELGETPERYDVLLLDKNGEAHIYATYIGKKKIK